MILLTRSVFYRIGNTSKEHYTGISVLQRLYDDFLEVQGFELPNTPQPHNF